MLRIGRDNILRLLLAILLFDRASPSAIIAIIGLRFSLLATLLISANSRRLIGIFIVRFLLLLLQSDFITVL